MSTGILIACDHRIMRAGLRSLLEPRPPFHVIGEAEDGWAAVRSVSELKPDVVLISSSLPALNGVDTTRRMLSAEPSTRIVMLASSASQKTVVGALEAGVSAYLLKSCEVEELILAIRAVLNNHVYLSPRIAGLVVDTFVRQRSLPQESVFSTLTAREREVLQLITEGNSTKGIAARLEISVKTVEYHRQQLMRRLSLTSIAALTKYAIREGVTSLDDF